MSLLGFVYNISLTFTWGAYFECFLFTVSPDNAAHIYVQSSTV